jgi:alkaline phosphatase D
MMTRFLFSALLLAAVPFAASGQDQAAESARRIARPKVLIIGDSISLGYTPHAVEMLKPLADVRHSKGNSQHTGTGLAKIDSWLGDEKWDVIHFNWGLWDLCYRHPESKVQGRRDKVRGTVTTSLDQYEKNLDKLTARLAKTGAVLIWAHTTVVPDGEAGRKVGDDLKYNAAAERVMKKHGVRINDLNKRTRTFKPELFTAPGNVHFKTPGSEAIARQVAGEIRKAISDRESSPASHAAEKILERILFGSCTKQEKPMPIFETMLAAKPQLCLFIGDNIYGDTEDMTVLKAKYDLLGANPGFAALRKSCPSLATWDDHDYGVNDGGADFSKRVESQKVFLDFWGDPADSVRRKRPGVYDAHVFGPEGKRVQIILLDTRYFRSPLKRGAERRTGGPWAPDDDPKKTVLGDAQWKWLEEQLNVPAEFRIVASSIQCLSEDDGQETWSNLPRERERFFQLLSKTKAAGVVIVSGDRHWAELSRVDEGVPYPLYDFTSSSFNQLHGRGTPTKNLHRAMPKTYHKENFGAITIDWKADPQMTFEIRDMAGKPQLTKTLRLSELQP